MKTCNHIDLQTAFVQQIASDIEVQWDKVELHFEYFNWKGKQFESYVSKAYFNEKKFDFEPSLEANDMLIEMIDQMSKGGEEKWTWCLFYLDSTGKYNFEYKYGMPPNTEALLRKSGELS